MTSTLNLLISGTILSSLAASAAQPKQPRPNVILIMTDQQFAEAMSCRMGDKYLRTPAMDNLAANGILFTRAYSPNPLSMPARQSLITGRYPHETGVTWNIIPKKGYNYEEFTSMGTYFRNAGYETAYYGKWHLINNQKAVDWHGFENMEPPVNDRTRGMSPDTRAADAAVSFISRNHTKPFMMYVSFLNPHNICEWARRASGMKQSLNCGEIGDPPAPDQLPPAPLNIAPPVNEPDGLTHFRKLMQIEGGVFPVAKFTADDWRRQRWGYYRMIELVDKEIGRIMDALGKAGLERNTMIIFTSDHGECAGAHSFNQKTVLYEESVRVPLIIAMKDRTKNSISDKLVNTGIDILPTIMECAGIEIPASLPGRSLWPQAMGKPATEWPGYVVSENDLRAWEVADTPRMQGRMVITGRYKYCVYEKGNQRESLVDLEKDPLETVNLAGEISCRKILLLHRAMLSEFGKKHNDPLVARLLENF